MNRPDVFELANLWILPSGTVIDSESIVCTSAFEDQTGKELEKVIIGFRGGHAVTLEQMRDIRELRDALSGTAWLLHDKKDEPEPEFEKMPEFSKWDGTGTEG